VLGGPASVMSDAEGGALTAGRERWAQCLAARVRDFMES